MSPRWRYQLFIDQNNNEKHDAPYLFATEITFFKYSLLILQSADSLSAFSLFKKDILENGRYRDSDESS